MKNYPDGYKWYILALAFLTDMFVVAAPSMGLTVLAKEISQDLHLDLVQFGVIWGIISVPSIITSLLGGSLGDRLGAKRMMMFSALATGLLVAARSLANDFFSLAFIVFLSGALIPFVTMNAIKIAGQWFPPNQLGLANGALGMGMGLGFMLGSLLSDSLLSPLLGGWRNVFLVYGLLGAAFAIPWYFAKEKPQDGAAVAQPVSIRSAVTRIARLKNIWLIGLLMLGVGGCVQGLLGYLPLYLRNLGWSPIQADQTVSAFHFASLVCVLPIAIWSDRLGSRKHLLIFASVMIMLGTGSLGFAGGGWILPAVLLTGFVRDSFMSIIFATTMEMEEIDPTLAGTAVGFVTSIGGLGNVLAPPLGNSLVKVLPSAPFIFWSFLALLGLICLLQIRRKKMPIPDLIRELEVPISLQKPD